MATPDKAKFQISGTPAEDGSGNRGYDATNGETLTLKLDATPPITGVQKVTFYLPDSSNPEAPQASDSAPELSFSSPGSGQVHELSSIEGSIDVAMPATGFHTYVIRCRVTTPDGTQEFDRAVVIRGLGVRKTYPAETTEYSARGWSPMINEYAGRLSLGRTFVDASDYDLVGDGTDQTANLQAALDAAEPLGAEVMLPLSDTGFTFSGATPIIVRPHVTLRGGFRGMRRGTRLFSVGNLGALLLVQNVTSNFIQMHHNAVIDGVEFFYPDQVTTGTPTAYPWTIEVTPNSHACTIRNVAAPNPYDFVKLGDLTGGSADGALLENVQGFPFRNGVDMQRCADVVRLLNVQFSGNNFPGLDSTVTDWVKANGTAFAVTGPEEFLATNVFAFGYNRMWWFTGAGSFHGVYGQWHGGGADRCNTCVAVDNEGLTSRGFKMVGVNLIPDLVGVQFSDTGGATGTPTEDEHPQVHMHDVNMWNGAGYDRPVWFQASSHGRLIVTGGRWRDSNNEAVGLIESADVMVRTYGLGAPVGIGNGWRWRDTTDAADVEEFGAHI